MNKDSTLIHTETKPKCILCGGSGILLYNDLHDRLFGASGNWAIRQCRNKDCGLLWLDPAPRPEDLWKAYIHYYTHHDGHESLSSAGRKSYHFLRNCYLSLKYGYFERHSASKFKLLGLLLYLFPGKRADADFSVMYLACKPQGKLLEIGCGSGAMLSYLSSLGWQVEGIDLDPDAVANARGKGLKVSIGSLEDQNFNDNTFDAVIMSHVIEHVPDPVKLLAECHRILKKGGTLSLVTPNTGSFGLKVFSRSWLSLDPPRHLILYNVKSIGELVRKSGFTNFKSQTTIREAHSLFWASYCIRRHGKFLFGSAPPRYALWLVLLLRMMEWFFVRFFPRKGEEISLLALK